MSAGARADDPIVAASATGGPIGAGLGFTEALQAIDPTGFGSALRALRPSVPHRLPAAARGASIDIDAVGWLGEQLPRERWPARVADASARRRREFLAARLCAEAVLRGLYCPAAVACGPAGEPIWPSGIVGSITHTVTVAHAAAAPAGAGIRLGIDSEPLAEPEAVEAIRDHCATPAEVRWLDAGADAVFRATLLFSAKEALYKALYPSVRRFIDYREVEVAGCRLESGRIAFATASGRDLADALRGIEGWFVFVGDQVHATVCGPELP